MTELGVKVGDDGGEKTPEILELLEDIMTTFERLKKLRKDCRAALPQLRKLGVGDMDKLLRTYAKLYVGVMDDVTVSQLKKNKKESGALSASKVDLDEIMANIMTLIKVIEINEN